MGSVRPRGKGGSEGQDGAAAPGLGANATLDASMLAAAAAAVAAATAAAAEASGIVESGIRVDAPPRCGEIAPSVKMGPMTP